MRLFPPVEGHDSFSEADGTKDLKPDLEAACPVTAAGEKAALLLGSGSLPARMRAALVIPRGSEPSCWEVLTADLDPVYERLAAALGIDQGDMNMEGACVVGSTLRWFQRGNASKGVASFGAEVDVTAIVDVVLGEGDPGDVAIGGVERYDLGEAAGVPLGITDAALLPDGRILVSAAAEDAPDAVADGPIVGAALAVLDGPDVLAVAPVPTAPDGSAWKVEGVAVESAQDNKVQVLAVVDQDDPQQSALALSLEVVLD